MNPFRAKAQQKSATDFLSDADEIERTPISGQVPAILYFLVLLLASLLLWAGLSEVDQVVTARGRLVSTNPHIIIQPIETAQIDSLNVSVGQIVRKGQVLATLDPTVIGSDLTQVRDRLNSLEAQSQRLQAELDGKLFLRQGNSHEQLQLSLSYERDQAQRARLQRFDENISRLKTSILSNAQEIAGLESRVRSQIEIEAMNEKLVEQQFQSRRLLLESRDKRLEVERELLNSKNRANDLKRELAALEAERSGFLKENRQRIYEELVQVRRERDAASEQLVKAERRTKFITIEAPEDSVVLELAKRSKGSIIREAEPFITLVPLDSPLEAEVRISASEIATIKADDRVRVKIDAFPFQKHGVLEGTLTKLSRDTVAVDESGRSTPMPEYLARVSFKDMKLKEFDKPIKLIPGMSLSAEVMIGERSVLSYVLYPIMRARDEAIKEP